MRQLRLRLAIAVLLVVLAGGALYAAAARESGTEEVPTLIWYAITTPQRDTEMVMDEINSFLPDRIGAKLDLRLLDWGEFDQKMQLIISSGEEWDLAFTSSWANGIYGNVSRGAFLLLDDYLPELVRLNFIHIQAPAMPPSTLSTCPVMYLASSEARKATASATSRGVPM